MYVPIGEAIDDSTIIQNSRLTMDDVPEDELMIARMASLSEYIVLIPVEQESQNNSP